MVVTAAREPSIRSLPRASLRVIFSVVLGEQIMAEIIFEIAPHAVDVVRLVLRVVELDHEGRPLDAVVMSLARLESTRPGEADLIEAGRGDFGARLVGELGAVARDVELEQ